MNGPESFTPDMNYILGEAPQVRGFYVGAGFNSMGIASSGGAGMALAEWIVSGEPTMDLWPVDIRRFAGFHGNDAWLRSRVAETPTSTKTSRTVSARRRASSLLMLSSPRSSAWPSMRTKTC